MIELPEERILGMTYIDHGCTVLWHAFLDGSVVSFQVICLTHGKSKIAKTRAEAKEILVLREWCPDCSAIILASRMEDMESRLNQ